jgi:hypothetical protein
MSFITETCEFCETVNHIQDENLCYAWECWNCLACQWFSEKDVWSYMCEMDIPQEIAEENLYYGNIEVSAGQVNLW